MRAQKSLGASQRKRLPGRRCPIPLGREKVILISCFEWGEFAPNRTPRSYQLRTAEGKFVGDTGSIVIKPADGVIIDQGCSPRA